MNEPTKPSLRDDLGKPVPDSVLTYIHAYGDSRADDDGLSGLRIAEAILALRRWVAADGDATIAALRDELGESADTIRALNDEADAYAESLRKTRDGLVAEVLALQAEVARLREVATSASENAGKLADCAERLAAPVGVEPVATVVRVMGADRKTKIIIKAHATADLEALCHEYLYPPSAIRTLQVRLAAAEGLQSDLADYFAAADAGWLEACEQGRALGLGSVPIGPAGAAALDKFNALRDKFNAARSAGTGEAGA